MAIINDPNPNPNSPEIVQQIDTSKTADTPDVPQTEQEAKEQAYEITRRR